MRPNIVPSVDGIRRFPRPGATGGVNLLRLIARRTRALARELTLPAPARALRRIDHRGLPATDPGRDVASREVLAWLSRAQDRSKSQDGGVARHFSLLDGWSASYPETTGYLIPTLLACAEVSESEEAAAYRVRARRMLDWLVSLQFAEGGFPGGVVGDLPSVPVTFNTGQILIGLAAGVAEFGDAYTEPMLRASNWLVQTQDPDGCWRKHPSPFAAPGEKAYETHVAWGLLEAANVSGRSDFRESALANVRWALGHQQANGWFDHSCLEDRSIPYTHALGYVLRGVLEAFRSSAEPDYLAAARRTADGALSALAPDGYLPGRLRSDWSGAVNWACLTGTVQLACCWFLLHRVTGVESYRSAGLRANGYVRRTLLLSGAEGVRGGVRGSFPIDGEYGQFQFLNWAAKFFLDSHLMEGGVFPQTWRDRFAPQLAPPSHS